MDQTKSQLDIKAVTLSAIWTLSGAELGEQKAIANLIGEKLLISILQDTPLNNNEGMCGVYFKISISSRRENVSERKQA